MAGMTNGEADPLAKIFLDLILAQRAHLEDHEQTIPPEEGPTGSARDYVALAWQDLVETFGEPELVVDLETDTDTDS
jgi:hypothetical protein